MDTCSQSELEKDIEDVKLLQEALRYQEDDPSQQQQALRALADILSQNSESFPFDKCSSFLQYIKLMCISCSEKNVSSELFTLKLKSIISSLRTL